MKTAKQAYPGNPFRSSKSFKSLLACVALILAIVAGGFATNLFDNEGLGAGPQSSHASFQNTTGDLPDILGLEGSWTYDSDEGVFVNSVSPSFDEMHDEDYGYEVYSPHDKLGRCGMATAILGRETMPAYGERRNNDGMRKVKPTGWKQAFYPDLIDINDGALYNRCHLIAWSLADEGANDLNLITGTRQLNEIMNGYETAVRNYIYDEKSHVYYRITPIFQDSELVARAVRMEASSAEDGGRGISFDILIPNVQEGVQIDYATGDSWQ